MSDDDASTIPPSTRAAPPPEEEKANKPDAIHVSIPRELYLIPGTTASAGLALGFLRGARKSSLRFLAENAHRAPRTVEEWYFYHKTKNYRVLLGGLRASGREGVRLGTAGVVWVGLEEGARRAGLGAWREVCAGVGLAGIVSLACWWLFYFFCPWNFLECVCR
jgi:hypothetical protein